jgi:hypothetical protein
MLFIDNILKFLIKDFEREKNIFKIPPNKFKLFDRQKRALGFHSIFKIQFKLRLLHFFSHLTVVSNLTRINSI